MPTRDLLSPPVPVADIKAIVTGKDCPHMKEKGALKQNKVQLGFGWPAARKGSGGGALPLWLTGLSFPPPPSRKRWSWLFPSSTIQTRL